MTTTIIAAETRAEFTKLIRMPAYAVPAIAFPLVFYVFFGIIVGGSHAADAPGYATYLIASYGAFGVIGASLFGLGVGIAMERGQGWLLLKRASPMPPVAYITGKIITAAAFSAIIVALLFVIAATAGHVSLTPATWAILGLALVSGALPFCALGCAVGWIAGPNSAASVVNLIYLPAAFLGGLWVPIDALPSAIGRFAQILPTYHLGQLGLNVLGFGHGTPVEHILALAVWTLIGIGVAVLAMRADEGRTYG